MQNFLETHLSLEKRVYTGVELRPHFILSEYHIAGDALVAFIGPCKVQTDHLVDWEDRLENETIVAETMLHFLGEFFGENLKATVLFQRLLIAELESLLVTEYSLDPKRIVRKGNDLYVDKKKVNVSIVTASPVSTLLHIGINLDSSGAPVPAIGLWEMDLPLIQKLKLTSANEVSDPLLNKSGSNLLGSAPPLAHSNRNEIEALIPFINRFFERAKSQWNGARWACAKVRPVM